MSTDQTKYLLPNATVDMVLQRVNFFIEQVSPPTLRKPGEDHSYYLELNKKEAELVIIAQYHPPEEPFSFDTPLRTRGMPLPAHRLAKFFSHPAGVLVVEFTGSRLEQWPEFKAFRMQLREVLVEWFSRGHRAIPIGQGAETEKAASTMEVSEATTVIPDCGDVHTAAAELEEFWNERGKHLEQLELRQIWIGDVQATVAYEIWETTCPHDPPCKGDQDKRGIIVLRRRCRDREEVEITVPESELRLSPKRESWPSAFGLPVSLKALRRIPQEFADWWRAKRGIKPRADTGQVGETEDPPVPKRPADLKRWKVTWQKIKHQWDKGKDYKQISDWLTEMHSDLACSPYTLARIIRAGEAGRLDD